MPGWSWPEVLPFFVRLEADADFRSGYHGAHGPLPVRRPSRASYTPLSAALVETATAAGYPLVADHNAPGATGVGPLPLNLVDGRRISTAAAYLDPVRGRPNLVLRAGTMVDRVLFDGVTATGVVPQPGLCDPADPCAQVVLRYTAPGSTVANDMQLYVLNHVELGVYAPHLDSVPGGRAFMVTSNLMAPRGRGTVAVVSRDPRVPPRISIDYGREAEDVRRQRAGVELGWDLLHQPAFIVLTKKIIDLDADTVRSPAALGAYVRQAARTAHHPAGTAQLGPASDPHAVADGRCRVHGTKQLRVADASIIPVPVRANTNLVSIMIGERVADWLD